MLNCNVLAKQGTSHLIMEHVWEMREFCCQTACMQQLEPNLIGVQPANSQFELYPFELKVL